ncbi:MAG: endopeptidase La [Bacteroidetes bacterium]|nr:endopeptidase La [Bacteroidota bacterium]
MPHEENILDKLIPGILPVLPLRDVVVFPHMIIPVLVGRASSLKVTQYAMNHQKYIFLTTQKDSSIEEPTNKDVCSEGTIARIIQLVKLPNNVVKVIVDGIVQGKIDKFYDDKEFIMAEVSVIKPKIESSAEMEALIRHSSSLFSEYVRTNRNIPPEVMGAFETITDPVRKLYFIAANILQTADVKQKLLQINNSKDQFTEIIKILTGEINILKIEREINLKVHDNIQKTQRKFIIQEQMKILNEELNELGGEEEATPEMAQLKKSIDEAKMPAAINQKAMEEFDKLKKIPTMSPEFSVVRNYLDWLIDVPWQIKTKDTLKVDHVKKILEEDHYGLKKTKERILEYISVLNLVKEIRGQILCLVGPPGVGKTSLAKSIARSLGRKYVRMSLGGIRDEAEIRGHRRTYIGSMPGKIIQAMKKAGSLNPVILLDEIDKMSMDFRGDPSAALLEVLDPEQNNAFNDHYLEVDYDLSKVMFITTANIRYHIPLPLQDRMEIIELSSYLDFEKLHIAKRHLIPKLLRDHGLKKNLVTFNDDAVSKTIRHYTRESGVRNLERELATVCRKIATQIVSSKKKKKTTVTEKLINKFLGAEKYRNRITDLKPKIGSVVGLAWTSMGGEILTIEVTVMKGNGKLTLTGQLGDVMKESAQAALSYIRSNAKKFKIKPDFFANKEIHIHIPEGAIPKDGPSAGITMAIAMISALSETPANSNVAMTGEITLRGKILAIGGLNEKLLAAKRNGITMVLIPKENVKDLADVHSEVKKGLRIIPLQKIEEATKYLFKKN